MLSTIVAGLGGAWLVVMHARMVLSPAPQEMREGAVVWITQLLLEGRNPYSLTELPEGANVYGIFYHLVVLPFARVFGNSFAVHRIVSAAAILGACALLYRMLRRMEVSRALSAIGVLVLYSSSVYFTSPLARPDSLGLFLSLASLTLLFRDRVTPAAFAGGLAFALLALSTKIYFAYPPFVFAAYVFLFESRRRGLVYGAVTVVAALATLAALAQRYPAYVNLAFVANAQADYRNAEHLRHQTWDWIVFSLPLSVGLLAALWPAAGRIGVVARGGARRGLYAFASAANAAVFLFWLGWHDGAHMTYLFQLVTPVLIPAVFPAIGPSAWRRALVATAAPMALVLNTQNFPVTLGSFSEAERGFRSLEQVIRAHQQVIGSPEIAGLLALNGRPVVDSGQSEFFEAAAPHRALPGAVPASAIDRRWQEFAERLARDLDLGRPDLVIRNQGRGVIPRDRVLAHYRRTGVAQLSFVWTGEHWPVELWEPAGD